MVYESDFYTTRRPYRSTYSVAPLTSLYYLSSVPKLAQAELIYRPTTRTVTRLATYPEPPHHVVRIKVRPSVILRELDRIQYLRRPAHSLSAVDDFYRSESTKHRASERIKLTGKEQNVTNDFFKIEWAFQDETRRIKADTASLLQRARSVVPRARSLAPLDTIYSYGKVAPFRFSNDDYIARLLLPLRKVRHDVNHMSYYNEPAKRFTGRGNLACVHYSGNKAFSSRRPLYKELSIRDDVNLLSFYAKNRLAAAGLAVDSATAGGASDQPTAAQCA